MYFQHVYLELVRTLTCFCIHSTPLIFQKRSKKNRGHVLDKDSVYNNELNASSSRKKTGSKTSLVKR